MGEIGPSCADRLWTASGCQPWPPPNRQQATDPKGKKLPANLAGKYQQFAYPEYPALGIALPVKLFQDRANDAAFGGKSRKTCTVFRINLNAINGLRKANFTVPQK
jgi:hypothetical protein